MIKMALALHVYKIKVKLQLHTNAINNNITSLITSL